MKRFPFFVFFVLSATNGCVSHGHLTALEDRRAISLGQTDSQVSDLCSTCVSFGHPLALIRTQVGAGFSPFGHPTQVDISWSQVNCIYVKFTAFLRLALTCEPACESVWPPFASQRFSYLWLFFKVLFLWQTKYNSDPSSCPKQSLLLQDKPCHCQRRI